ncbi:helicase-related protein [Streptomyces sp.]|uniref:helicase-related protein n=1 Tax=Streptomyces sp. TaxID=1931 RepID=UPI00281146AB|nr:helicase-related protein [Streptomyces sp.]
MREQDLRHVFVYFQQIADAADFARQFAHTLRTLPDELRPDFADDVVVQSIDGTHSPHRRADSVARFSNAERGVLANAKVLDEGVDLPAVDAVVFADRTASVRRIVQALGRVSAYEVLSPGAYGRTSPAAWPQYGRGRPVARRSWDKAIGSAAPPLSEARRRP